MLYKFNDIPKSIFLGKLLFLHHIILGKVESIINYFNLFIIKFINILEKKYNLTLLLYLHTLKKYYKNVIL